jgi:hypothetical protein
MGTKSSTTVVSEAPPDPDPTPIHASSTSQEVRGASRQEKKRIAGNYGRKNTILAGNTPQDNSTKKTILGG